MRYQVVVLADEIGEAIEIESLSWKRFPSPDDQANFSNLAIHLGLCESDELVSTYDDNYIEGTKTLVLSAASYSTPVVGVNEWFEVVFDTPYWYNGEDNLIIEIEWSDGIGSVYVWNWEGVGTRCVHGLYGQSSGPSLTSKVPHLLINGTLALVNSTFGYIKASF